jgi:hypothetical protein
VGSPSAKAEHANLIRFSTVDNNGPRHGACDDSEFDSSKLQMNSQKSKDAALSAVLSLTFVSSRSIFKKANKQQSRPATGPVILFSDFQFSCPALPCLINSSFFPSMNI